MGPGRRMKKQGPPAPLNEARFATLKAQKLQSASGVKPKRKATQDLARGPAKKPAIATPARPSKQASSNSSKANGRASGKYESQHATVSKGKHALRNGIASEKQRPVKQSKVQPTKTDEDAFDDFEEDDDVDLDDPGLDGTDSEDIDASDNEDDFLDSGSSVYDSDQEQRRAVFSEDEDESDAEEKLTAANIEGLARKLDATTAADNVEAERELRETGLQTNIDGERPKILDDDDSDEADLAGKTNTKLHLAPDLQVLRTRMTETVRVLDDFAKLAEPGRSRADYTSQLLKDICDYYGYSPFLADKLFNLFPPREAFEFFEANETPRPVVLRTNTLKTHRRELAQSLISRGVTLEPVGKWSKIGLQVFESQVPLGATPEYLSGQYLLQAASSFLPVMALGPQEHERILDMAAAPGGKTTHMAALMRNTGCIFANDSNKARSKGLIGNIHRLGARNTIVCQYDARLFPKIIGGFDRVLLDAPCSGTGVIAKDPSVKTNKTTRDFLALPHLQKQLLLAAIDSVDHSSKTGGYVVYSTCSVTVEENEQVVQYALRTRPNVRIVDSALAFGVEAFTNYMGKTFDPSMRLARRYYPHTYNVDGFFVCKLQKTGPTKNAAASPATQDSSNGDGKVISTHTNGGTRHDGVPFAEDEVDGQEPAVNGDGVGDDFGGWNEAEDAEIIARARRRALRRKGLDPRAQRQNGAPKAAKTGT